MKLKKHKNNPILSPLDKNEWESLAVCNPGAWYEDGKFYLLYRAAGNDEAHKIHLGLAESTDGFNFKRVSDMPVFSPSEDGPDAGCVEDPRIVKFGDTFYITYAYRPFPPGQYWNFGPDEVLTYNIEQNAPVFLRDNVTNTGLLTSKDLKTFKRVGRIFDSRVDNRDVILFPEKINDKFVMLQRPKEWVGPKYKCNSPSIWISFSDDMLECGNLKLLAKGKQDWERKIGGSTPPIKTDKGWLMLYHAVDDNKIYRVGAMLLDLNNPLKILARSKDFIMEPEYDYERVGLYNGCVFPTGNVVVDGTLYVYYGGADKYCCVATCDLDELLKFLLKK